MFCTRVAWVCLICLLLYKEEGSSPVWYYVGVNSNFQHASEEYEYKRAYVF